MRCLSMSTLSNHNAFYVLVGCCNRAWTPVSTPLIITNPHRYEPIGQYKSDLFLFFYSKPTLEGGITQSVLILKVSFLHFGG